MKYNEKMLYFMKSTQFKVMEWNISAFNAILNGISKNSMFWSMEHQWIQYNAGSKWRDALIHPGVIE